MSKGKILIISSKRATADNIKNKLNGIGYKSIVADDLERISEHINKSKPDLYLVDINLKSGSKAKKIKAQLPRTKNIPLVYFVPENEPSDLNKLKKLKAYEYIFTSGSKKEIKTAIEAAIALASREIKFKEGEDKIRQGSHIDRKLKEKKPALDTLMSNLPGMAYRCLNDRDWTMEFVSEGCEELTGYQPSELIDNKKTSYNQIIHPDDTEKIWDNIQAAISENRVFTITYRIYTKNDQLKWVWERGCGIYDENGDLAAIEGFISDITHRIQMEDRLKNAFLEKEMILDSLLEHVILEDEDLKIIWANKAACESLQMPRDEVIGRHCYELWAQRQEACPKCAVEKAIKTGRPQQQEKTTSDGKSWLIQGHPVYDTDGNIVGGIEVTLEITEHRQTEKALEKSESKYFELYENLRDGSAAVDMTGRITDFNPAFQKMLGYTREEIFNLTYNDITPEKWHEKEKKIIDEQVLTKGYSDLYEKEYIKKDGTVFPIELRTYLIRDDKNEPVGMWAFIRDITRRKEIEKARLEQENRLRSVVENMPVMMNALDENGHILVWNQECERVTGFSSEEIINNPRAIEMLYPDRAYRKSMMAEWKKRGNNYRDWEWNITCKDGSVKIISWSSLSEVIPIPGWASWGIGQDVTECKKTLKELQRLGRAVEQSFDGIVMIDLKGNIQFVNRTWATIHGYERDELMNKHMSIFHPNRHMEEDVLSALLDDHHTDGWVGMVEHLRKDGTILPTWMTISILKNDAGRPIGFVGTARDITESKKVEQALKESEEQYRLLAETANDMILTHNIIGKITYTNNALVELTGCNEQLLKNMNITALLPDAKLGLTFQADKITDGPEERPLIYKTELVTKNRQRIPVEISSAPLIKDNQVIGRLIIARDIRERQQAEQALKESESRYRRIIENTIDLIYSCSPEGTILYISPQISNYGFSVDEVLGRNILEFVNPDDVEHFNNDIRRTVEFGEKAPTEFRFIGKDKTEYYVEEIGKVVCDGEDIIQVTGVIRDITDRKLAEKALLNSEEKYRLLIENANDGIFVVQNGEFKFFNPKAIAITGYTLSEAENLKLTDLIHEDDREMVLERHRKRLQGFDAPDLYHFRIVDKYKDVRWLEINVVRITWENQPATLNFISDVTERKQAEEVIRKSEERFRTMADFTYDWESWIGPDGKYIYVSPSCERVTGYRAEEFLQDCKLMQKITHPDDREKVVAHLNDRLDISRPHSFEFRIIARDGSHVCLEHVCQPVYSPDGRYLGRRFSNRDTTERKAMLEALVESEEKYSTLIEKAKDGIMVIQDEIIKFVNKAMADMSGYTIEELIGLNYLDLTAPESKELISQRYKLRLTGKNPPSFYEIKLQCKDETIKDIELSVGIIKYLGQPATVAILRNVTERKKVEEHIRRNLAALDAATDGIAIINKNYEYTYLNLAHARMYGYDTPFELIHSTFQEHYDENKIQRFDREILPALEKCGFWRGEITGKKKDGTLFPEELSLTVLEEGGMISIVRDITDIKNTENQRRQLQEMLERAERMESLGILAGGVAHDLNNMLGPLVAYSDLILEEADGNDRTRKMVERIGKASRIAADIIQDLLTLARRGRYEMTATNLNDVIETYLDSPSYARLTKNRPDIELELNLDPSIGDLHGSLSHLSKTVMNLVINAFDAMPGGGKLTIETTRRYLDKLYGGHDKIDEGEYIIFKVRDTGMGIDPKDLPKIFEPYYSKKKMGASGSGLGLAVVYGIVKDHHGYYDIFSEVGRGTEFIFYFPVSRVSEKTAPNDSPVKDLAGNETVLVVDDVEQQREMAFDLLTSLGYQVTTVASGREAVDYLKDHQVDLVVMDMIMEKDFDGLDTYQEILKIRPGQKAVITSGFSATERVNEMQELGAGAYIKKPYTRQSLGRAIREELDDKVKTELTAG